MSKKFITREKIYEFEGTDTKLRIKKWSAGKLLTMVSLLGGLLEEVIAMGSNGAQINEHVFMARIIIALCNSEDRALALIQSSAVHMSEGGTPKKEEILAWDPEDFMGVLESVLSLNLTESMKKKLPRILGRATEREFSSGNFAEAQQN